MNLIEQPVTETELLNFLTELNAKRKAVLVAEYPQTIGNESSELGYDNQERLGVVTGTKNFKVVKVAKGPRYTGHRPQLVTLTSGVEELYVCAVFCFIDRATGNILKAAGFNAPAKGVRGNIRGDWWNKAITVNGAAYLR